MQNLFNYKTLLLICCTSILFSCKKTTEDRIETFNGSEIVMGEGQANSFFTVNSQGIPQELGIEMTQEALTGLTENPADFRNLSFVLNLHQKAKEMTAFDHLVIHWNPQGHPPANVFTTPHFDFNFYLLSSAERSAIPPYNPSTAAMFDNLPPAGFMPSGYSANPGGVPGLGKIWGDHHMQLPFTHTMVYGSYNGKVAFVGPMVTKAIVENGTKVKTNFEQPQQFPIRKKYYPTRYNVYTDNATHKHYMSLSDFVLR